MCFSAILAQKEKLSKSLTETVECSATFKITKFQLSDSENTIAFHLPYKVVFGRKIGYRAKPRNDGLSFNWHVGRYDSTNTFVPFLPYMISPDTPTPYSGQGTAFLYRDSLPMLNSELGYNTSGVVRAIKYIEDDSLFAYTSESEEIPKVRFFFEKDSMNVHDMSVPNWFYYWTQNSRIQDLLTIPGFTLYDRDSCRYNSSPTEVILDVEYNGIGLPYNPTGNTTYGQNSFSVRAMNIEALFENIGDSTNCIEMTDPAQRVAINYNNSNRIEIGEGCGYRKGMNVCDPLIGNHEGIHTLYTTLIHEVEHAIIECDIWEFTHPSDTTVFAGYNSLWDLDNDGYKDL